MTPMNLARRMGPALVATEHPLELANDVSATTQGAYRLSSYAAVFPKTSCFGSSSVIFPMMEPISRERCGGGGGARVL